MDRIDRIIGNRDFQENLMKNRAAEADRRFCRHDMVHFLDVARIGTILSLEEGIIIDKELLYGAALLHDIGRHRQYKEGIPHEQASALIAPGILRESGFTEEEIGEIVAAIASHRDEAVAREASLRGLLYRADKASRPCYACLVEQECNWKSKKKNLQIKY